MKPSQAQELVFLPEFTHSRNKEVDNETFDLKLSPEILQKLQKADKQKIKLSLPINESEWVSGSVEQVKIFQEDFRLTDEQGKIYSYEKPIAYAGDLVGQSGKINLISYQDRLIIMCSIPGQGNFHYVPAKDGSKYSYLMYSDKELIAPPFTCETDDSNHGPIEIETSRSAGSVDNCVEVYLEADHHMFQDFGSVTAVMDYLAEVWLPVSSLFTAEEITINISEVMVWTTVDPYSDVNAGVALSQFQTSAASYNGDLAHLVSTNNANIGGIAFIDALCTDFAYGFSNITTNYGNLPVYSWTVNVLAHEIGHTLGSLHTHNCNWPNGPIDDCAEPEGSCAPGPTPTNGGTIMSYCHLLPIGIDFNNGFGTLPGNLIRDRVSSGSCLEVCSSSGGGGSGGGTDPPSADFAWSVAESCVQGAVLFQDASSGNPDSFFWEFEGGVPSTSTEENPFVQYPNAGTYSASLTVTNAGGSDEVTKTNIFQIGAGPNLSHSYTTLGTSNQIQFTGISSDALTWMWDFGDGSSSFQQNPSHTYATAGTYHVSVTVANACGTQQENFTIEIGITPVAQFGTSTTTGCNPFVVNFIDQSLNNPTSYSWNFGSGNPSNSSEQNPVVSFNAPGNHDVSLQVSNDAGTDFINKENYILVIDEAIADFSYTQNGPIVNFQNNSSNTLDVLWNFGDGTSSTQMNPSHSYAVDGTYEVSLTVTNICNTDVYVEQVSINVAPDIGFTVPSFEGCAPYTVYFTNLTQNITSINWEFQGGVPSTSTEFNPIVTYPNAGAYDVTMTVSNGFNSMSKTFEEVMKVYDEPIANFSYNANDLTYQFQNLSADADAFLWEFGDGSVSTMENPQHNYTEEGFYQVTLTVNGYCGMDVIEKTVQVFTEPEGYLESGQSLQCVNQEFQFETDFSDNISEYLWELLGPETITSTLESPVFNIPTEGVYSIRITLTNPSGEEEIWLPNYLTVEAPPEPDFTYQVQMFQVSFTDQSQGVDNYLWNFGDGGFSSSPDPSHFYTAAGTYQVSLQTSNACGSKTTSKTLVVDALTSAGFSADQNVVCQGSDVQFSNASTSGASTFLWTFPGGIPSTSTDENPIIKYDTPGVYSVTLEASDGQSSDVLEQQGFIQVDALYELDLQYSSITHTTIRFNHENPLPGEYQWNWGDGTSSSVSSPVHSFPEQGTYDIQLIYSNSCAVLDTTFQLLAYGPTHADFTLDQAEVCLPAFVSPKNESSQNSESWTWSAPGSIEGTSNEENPIFSYSEPGRYNITLTAKNPLYEDDFFQENVIEVLDVPVAEFDHVLDNEEVLFENLSSFGDIHEWTFGDGGLTSLPNPTHDYDQQGVYTVTLTEHNICGSDTEEKQVAFYLRPEANFESATTEICAHDFVALKNSSVGVDLSYTWEIEGGSPSVSNFNNPSIVFENGGVFDVSLIVSNPVFSDTLIYTDYIYVDDVPETDFSFVQDGFDFEFKEEANNADAYFWDFGDGQTSQEVNPKHSYSSNGSYSVWLTTQNKCGTSNQSYNITPRAIPNANFATDRQTICKNETIQFTNQSAVETEEYLWIFEGANISSTVEPNPMVTYSIPGRYDVTLIARSAFGVDTLVWTDYMTVEDDPISMFTVNAIGNQLITENLSNTSDQSIWLSGDEVSMELNPVFVKDSNGVYPVTLITYNQCGSDTLTYLTAINSLPEASALFAQEFCVGEPAVFSSTSVNATSYTWIVNQDIVQDSTSSELVYAFEEAGDYDITLVASNFWGSDTIRYSNAVEVIGPPTAAFVFTFMGEDILFSDLSEGALDYTWDFGDGNMSTNAGDQFHNYEQADVYEVSLIVSNACFSDTSSLEVNANILLPELVFFSNHELCAPTELVITEQSTGDPVSWYWKLDGPQVLESYERVPNWLIEEPGHYDLYVEISNQYGGVSEFYPQLIYIKGPPEASFDVQLQDGLLQYQNQDSIAVNYAWDFGDGASSELSNGTHQYESSGDYTIVHRSFNECGEMSTEREISVNLSNPYGKDHVETMAIYPNPTRGISIIDMKAFINHSFDIEYYNILGQLVMTENKNPIGGLHQFETNLSHLPKGTYLVTVRSDKILKTVKLILY